MLLVTKGKRRIKGLEKERAAAREEDWKVQIYNSQALKRPTTPWMTTAQKFS